MQLSKQIVPNVAVFARTRVANGQSSHTNTLSLKGKLWGRPDDTFAIAGIVNDISGVHQAYLNAGGLGILVGDGMSPSAGRQKILETYYSFPVLA